MTGAEQPLALGQLAGQSRASQSQRSRQGRAPVSRYQVAVRFHQGPLQRASQKYGAADVAVRAEQCVDSAKTFAGCTGDDCASIAGKLPNRGLKRVCSNGPMLPKWMKTHLVFHGMNI